MLASGFSGLGKFWSFTPLKASGLQIERNFGKVSKDKPQTMASCGDGGGGGGAMGWMLKERGPSLPPDPRAHGFP